MECFVLEEGWGRVLEVCKVRMVPYNNQLFLQNHMAILLESYRYMIQLACKVHLTKV
jgi:hypothetical protein